MFVYVMQCRDLVKIGISYNPESRASLFQIGNPFGIKLIAKVKSSSPSMYEKALHAQFSHRKVHGEWFKLEKQELDELINEFQFSPRAFPERSRIKRQTSSKMEPEYWAERIYKNTFTYHGDSREVRYWSVKIQHLGARKTFSLRAIDVKQAATEACSLYKAIVSAPQDI